MRITQQWRQDNTYGVPDVTKASGDKWQDRSFPRACPTFI